MVASVFCYDAIIDAMKFWIFIMKRPVFCREDHFHTFNECKAAVSEIPSSLARSLNTKRVRSQTPPNSLTCKPKHSGSPALLSPGITVQHVTDPRWQRFRPPRWRATSHRVYITLNTWGGEIIPAIRRRCRKEPGCSQVLTQKHHGTQSRLFSSRVFMQISGWCLICSSRTANRDLFFPFFYSWFSKLCPNLFFCLCPFLELSPTRKLPVPAEPGLLQDEGRRPDEQDTVKSTQNSPAVQSVQPLKKLTDAEISRLN